MNQEIIIRIYERLSQTYPTFAETENEWESNTLFFSLELY
ncbi:hypothetical protein PAECIP111894_05432 [Paenibacillus pseudetheri]|uniref:Uncharacterized protein n=1 Tax=Paenibacillus pseudetheri TaxID=2897682 RepID=A0ABM9BMB5_9BACL|nr:hypothetical protein PAECIP111894_05432 [Paenibacillus pseudetheri]